MRSDVENRAHLGNCYEELGEFGDRVREFFLRSPALPGPFPQASVAARIAQRVADILHAPYLVGRNRPVASSGSRTIDFGGILLDTGTGNATLHASLRLRSLFSFFRIWTFLLFSVLLCIPKRRAPAATLILGLTERDLRANGDIQAFLEFCRNCPVAPLRQATGFVVQDPIGRSKAGEEMVRFSRIGLLHIAIRAAPGFGDRTRFIRDHVSALWTYLSGCWRYPVFSLLDRDFAYLAIAKLANSRSALKDVIFTNTWYSEQPLWATDLPERSFGSHMVFYSMMGRAFAYRDVNSSPAFPGFRFMRADAFWVWTPGQAQLLRDLGVPGSPHVAGPILWRPPRSVSRTGRNILVFDVTPVKDDFARSLGLRYNYYSSGNCERFLLDIVSACSAAEQTSGVSAHIVIKHKRGYADIHSPEYIRTVNTLCASGQINFVPPDADLYGLFDGSCAAVVMPFSSPAYIAHGLGIPAIYYDPTGQLLPTTELLAGIEFSGEKSELRKFLTNALLTTNAGTTTRATG